MRIIRIQKGKTFLTINLEEISHIEFNEGYSFIIYFKCGKSEVFKSNFESYLTLVNINIEDISYMKDPIIQRLRRACEKEINILYYDFMVRYLLYKNITELEEDNKLYLPPLKQNKEEILKWIENF